MSDFVLHNQIWFEDVFIFELVLIFSLSFLIYPISPRLWSTSLCWDQGVQVATMTRDQTPHASSLTGDDSPGVQLLQEPVICTVGGAINFPHSAKTNLVRDGEHDCTSVAHGNQANSLCFQADHVQRVLGVGDRSPGVCDKLPSTGVESVTADSIDKPQCSEGTLPRSLQEGEQLRCVGRAGGAAVGSGQDFHTHIAENLPRNRQDGVSSLEP